MSILSIRCELPLCRLMIPKLILSASNSIHVREQASRWSAEERQTTSSERFKAILNKLDPAQTQTGANC